MSELSWTSLLNNGAYSQVNTGTALASSVTLTDISPGGNTVGQALSIPGGFLIPGLQVRVRANGILSNTATPTLLLGVYYGGVAGTAIAATTALTTASGLSGSSWMIDLLIRVETVGTSGTVRGIGLLQGPYAATQMLPAAGATATINTGTANILTIGAQWGTNSASNTLTCQQFLVETLN